MFNVLSFSDESLWRLKIAKSRLVLNVVRKMLPHDERYDRADEYRE